MNKIKIKMTPYGNYSCPNDSTREMVILGRFLAGDVGCDMRDSFRRWALDGEEHGVVTGNCTILEKKVDVILLSEIFSLEKSSTQLSMTVSQFVRLFEDWRELVAKERPKEIIVKHEYDCFFIEAFKRSSI